MQRNLLSDIKKSCTVQQIHTSVVPFELRHDVRALNYLLQTHNKTVAVPLDNLSVLYKLPVADCVFSRGMVTATVSISVTAIGEGWELYEVTPFKFALHGQTCSLVPNDPKLVAKKGSKIVEINPILSHRCRVYDEILCYVPQCHHDSSSSAKCAAGLLDGRPMSELTKYCQYTCSPDDDLVVQQVREDEVIAANVDHIQVTCFNETGTTHFPQVGAVHIFPKCICTYLVNGNYPIHPAFICDLTASDEHFTHVIPSSLANSTDDINWNDLVFANLSRLNLQLDVTFPVLNLSGLKWHCIPEPPVLSI